MICVLRLTDRMLFSARFNQLVGLFCNERRGHAAIGNDG